MALTLGTNVGFVSTAPSADPAGSDTTIDGSSVVVKDISPAGARKITQIGWYRGSGTNTANFEIALYSEASGVADARLYVDDTNSSSAGGWITVAVDWEIQPNTAYWIGLQMDAHTGSSTVDSATSGGLGIDVRTSQTALNNPYGGGAVSDADGMYAIYALYQKSPTVALNSPADASSGSDTTPTLDFTGTDAEANDIRYQLQVTNGNFDVLVDTKANSGVIASDNEYSFNITIANNAKRFLTVTVSCRDNDNPTNRPVTGITADGVAMTLLTARSMTDGDGDDVRSEIWGLANPNTGTIAIVVTHTGTVDHAGATALSLYNAKQHVTPNTTGFDEDTQSTATTDPLTNLTTTVNNCLIIDAAYHQDGANLTAGTGQTVIEQLGVNGGGDRAISSYKYANIVGVNSMSWTAGTKDAFVQVAVAIESAGYVSRRTLTSGVDTTDDADSTTASITPTANTLVFIDIESKTESTTDPNTPTATGCGLTWVLVDSIVTDPTSSSRRRITRLRGMGSSPTSGVITIDFGGQTQVTKAWVVEELHDTDTSGTNGSGAVVQTGKENQTDEEGAAASLSVTLSAFSNLNNAVHAMSGQGNGSSAVTAGSGFTLGGNATDSGENNIEVNTEFRNDNDTTADFSYSPSDSGMGIIASEIKAAVQIVLNKVSGTDSGFANPDVGGDTDPFTSGDNIQFTVQAGDALASGTYYWRVRAIDPSGSNLYGPWSNMRSFIINANTTQNQTITGIARIQKAVSQTILGKARITALTTQTIQGLARIRTSVSQTIQGLARITASTTRTITGIATIQNTTSRTITGIARITASTLQTITGKARITNSVSQTIQGLARITASTAQTITGLARITATTSRTITGLSRIQKSVSQTITGLATILAVVTKNITGISRITAVATKTIQGLARITATTTKTITGLSRITNSVSQTIQGLARITVSTTRTIQGLARITATASQDILGVARIRTTVSQTIAGLSRITSATTRTIQGLSRITASTLQTLTGLARITATGIQTILGKARITISSSQTIQGISRITNSVTQAIQGISRITGSVTQTLTGQARITASTLKTILGRARITNVTVQTIAGLARIQQSVSESIFGKASIVRIANQTITGVARIIRPEVRKSIYLTDISASKLLVSISQSGLNVSIVTSKKFQNMDIQGNRIEMEIHSSRADLLIEKR